MNKTEATVRQALFAMQDLQYRDFHAKLMPTVNKANIIGVRTPQLRKFAAEFSKTPEAEEFLKILPHRYYEENNLHAFLIERIRDYNRVIREISRFLPYVDNWATCDMMSPKIFKNHPEALPAQAKCWIESNDIYAVRYGIGILMNLYLDEKFLPEYPKTVAQVQSEEYYIKMMIAWYFATALAKQYEAALPYLENRLLDSWTHNKAIQKAIESRRITPKKKSYLKTLKIPMKTTEKS